MILFGLAITIPLMFRGLYFEEELLPSLIGIYALFIVWALYKSKERDFKLLSTPIDYLFMGVVLMYLLSITYGVDKREAVIEFSRYLAYFIIFIMAKNISNNKKYEKSIINIILLGGMLVSIIGIGTAIGTWEYTGAMIYGRLSSTFQYPNTLAAYVVALYFIAMTALINEENKILKGIYGLTLATFVFSLILTSSRATWLIFPLVVAIYFIILPNVRKMESILYMVSSVVLSIPVAFIFNSRIKNPTNKLWIMFILTILGTGMMVFFISLLDKKLREMSTKKLLISLIFIGAVLCAGVVYVINATTTLVMENVTTEDKTTTIFRNIYATLPNVNYSLEVSYIGENNSESPYVGKIIIYNMNDKGQLKSPIVQNLIDIGERNIKIDFTTLEDSVGIQIHFQNIYKNTKVEFLDANIIDSNTTSIIKKIPLKYKYINEAFVSRIQTISAGENSFVARMIFNKDGLKVLGKNPILGAGGGGWLSMYQIYQSYPYSTALAHNYLLQMWIEIGTIGILLFITMIVFMSIYLFSTYRRSEDVTKKTTLVGLAVTIIAMLLHAVVDFDMSLPSYTIIFWTIMGILVSNLDIINTKIDRIVSRLNKISSKSYIYGIVLIAGILILNHSLILYSQKYKIEGATAFANNDLDGTIDNFEKVVKYDRYEGTYKMDLASCYIGKYRETNDIEYVKKAINLVDSYIEISPYDSFAYVNAANFNFSIGEVDKGIAQLDKSVELQPMKTGIYTQKIVGYRAVVDHYLSQGEDKKAKNLLAQALGVKENIKRVNENAYKPMVINNELVQSIGEVQFMYENLDELQEIANKGLRLHFAYYFDLDINHDGNIDMLQTYSSEGSKIGHDYMTEGDDTFIRITNEGEMFGFKYVYPLDLEPNTTYVVELKARGTTKPETFNLYAWSNGSADPNQGSHLQISITDDWQTHTFEFITDDDVISGAQHIIMQHNGNDTGYIDIKDLVIYRR